MLYLGNKIFALMMSPSCKFPPRNFLSGSLTSVNHSVVSTGIHSCALSPLFSIYRHPLSLPLPLFPLLYLPPPPPIIRHPPPPERFSSHVSAGVGHNDYSVTGAPRSVDSRRSRWEDTRSLALALSSSPGRRKATRHGALKHILCWCF